MSSSSDFEDVPPISKSSDTSLPKKEASSQYLTMLNSNTKFNEMLKNKIKQTGVSPLLNTHDFNPVASSTQIGTPDELKRKSIKKQSDVKTSPKKKGLSSSVVVKREPVSFESGDENITKQPKLKKKKADLQMESKRRKEEAQTVSRLTSTTQSKKSGAANESESSVDSESDSHSSVPPSPRTKHSKESTGSLNRSRKQSSSESSEDEGRPTIMSKEPVYGQSNSKINFSKFNNKTKSTISNSDSEPESLRPSLPVKRELHSDVEHVSKKKKHKVTPKPSSSGSSEDQDHVSARQKNQKNKQKVPPKTSSSSSSEGEDDVPVRASSSGTRRESMTRSSSDSPSQKNVSKASNRKKTKHGKRAVVEENGDKSSSSSSESEAELRIQKGKIRKRQAERLSEDDGESMHQTKKTATSRLRKFEKEDSLETVATSFDVLNDISSKEDVYIIQIPVKLDPRRLIGSSISLNGSVRFNKKYDSIISVESQDPIVVATNNNSKSLKVIGPVGTIKLQRRLRYEKVCEIPELINKTVAFPSNLKSRHPLFGSNFDKKIDLDEHVQMKLDSLCEPNVKKKKKKKKLEKEQQEEEIFKFLTVGNEESAPVEKKKKKKSGHDLEDQDESMSKKRKHSESEDLHKKKKKKKHKEDSNDTLIQEMLSSKIATLDVTKKKKKKKKEEC